MVDLLGLIRPDTVDAMRRQDFFWTIADSQADAVVLTGKNPLWFQNLKDEPDAETFPRHTLPPLPRPTSH